MQYTRKLVAVYPVYEFDNGCLFGGEGCVSGLEYSATVPSSAGFPATEEVQEGAFDEENVEWHIRTKHMMMVCQNSIGRCLGMQEFLLFEEYLVLELNR